MDRGLLAAGIIMAIVLSALIGFCLGVKFHSQVMGQCRRTPDEDSPDGPGAKNVEGVSYMRSPPRGEGDSQGRQSKRKLVNHTADGETEPNVEDEGDDESSDGSLAGKFSEGRSLSPSILQERKAPLANGEVVNM